MNMIQGLLGLDGSIAYHLAIANYSYSVAVHILLYWLFFYCSNPHLTGTLHHQQHIGLFFGTSRATFYGINYKIASIQSLCHSHWISISGRTHFIRVFFARLIHIYFLLPDDSLWWNVLDYSSMSWSSIILLSSSHLQNFPTCHRNSSQFSYEFWVYDTAQQNNRLWIITLYFMRGALKRKVGTRQLQRKSTAATSFQRQRGACRLLTRSPL